MQGKTFGNRVYQRADPTQRFWAKVNRNGPIPSHCMELGPCWIWIASYTDSGYGRFSFTKGHWVPAHRFSWELHNAPIPQGLWVLHRCDTPACVRPNHLFLGTVTDNARDMAAKGRGVFQQHPERAPRGERNGSIKHPERLARGDDNPSRKYPERRPRGEQHANARLSIPAVLAIRRAVAAGESVTGIANRYQIAPSTVYAIVTRRTWAWLHGETCNPAYSG